MSIESLETSVKTDAQALAQKVEAIGAGAVAEAKALVKWGETNLTVAQVQAVGTKALALAAEVQAAVASLTAFLGNPVVDADIAKLGVSAATVAEVSSKAAEAGAVVGAGVELAGAAGV